MTDDSTTASSEAVAAPRARAEQVHRLLVATHFRYNSETELQEQIKVVLAEAGLVFGKEYVLTEHDRPDFFFEDVGLAVEVKIAGALSTILRQLKRYADHPKVQAVLLVSQRPHPLPATLSGKRIYLCSIWRSGII